MLIWKRVRQNWGKWTWDSGSTGSQGEVEKAWRGENRRKNQAQVDHGGVELTTLLMAAWYSTTLTLVQLVLLHDDVLQLGAHFLLLMLDGRRLPAVFLIYLPSTHRSTSTPSCASVWVYIVAHDGGLDELGGGVRGRLTAWTHKASIFEVRAVECLHFIDLVWQVYVSVQPRLWHHKIGLLVFHLVVIVGDAVSWRTRGGGLVNLAYRWPGLQLYLSSLTASIQQSLIGTSKEF